MDAYGDQPDDVAGDAYHRLTDEELQRELLRVQQRNARLSAVGTVPESYQRELRRLYELRDQRGL